MRAEPCIKTWLSSQAGQVNIFLGEVLRPHEGKLFLNLLPYPCDTVGRSFIYLMYLICGNYSLSLFTL